MPSAPNYDGFEGLKFITNYFLMGCTPPSYVCVDFSEAPVEDMWMLMFGLDPFDIVQGLLNPGGPRRERPGRHGRKRRRGPGFPDVNEAIAKRAKVPGEVVKGIRMSPLKYVFPVLNAYEGVAFSAAILEGLTDIGYSVLWGTLLVNPDHCREFARLSRHFQWDFEHDGPYVIGGAGPAINPVGMQVVDFAVNFSSTLYSASCFLGSWNIAASVTVLGRPGGNYLSKGRLALGTIGGTIVEYSSQYELDTNQVQTVEISGNFDAGQFIQWGITDRFSTVWVLDGSITAYVDAPIFQ